MLDRAGWHPRRGLGLLCRPRHFQFPAGIAEDAGDNGAANLVAGAYLQIGHLRVDFMQLAYGLGVGVCQTRLATTWHDGPMGEPASRRQAVS